MEFRVPGFSVGMQHNQVYPTPSASVSFNYTNFSDQTSEGGPARMREAIQRELEKEMIREKIIAEEVERFHVLEAEVRRELMIGREMMAMKNGMGFPSSFMLGPQPGEIRQPSTLPLKVGTGNLNCPTLPEATLKPPPPPPPPPSLPATGGSTEHNPCIPKKKMEWRCSICKISTTCERGLLEHLAGKSHHVKAASIVMNNSPKCSPSSHQKMEWRCSICEVSAPCEQGLQDHLAGKKHESKVAALKADNTETELLEKKMEWTWMCPICKIEMKSEINFQSHLAGKKHKAKVAIRKGKII